MREACNFLFSFRNAVRPRSSLSPYLPRILKRVCPIQAAFSHPEAINVHDSEKLDAKKFQLELGSLIVISSMIDLH